MADSIADAAKYIAVMVFPDEVYETLVSGS